MNLRIGTQVLVAVFVVGTLSGCTAGPSHPLVGSGSTTVAYSSAAPPKAEDEFGSISGLVIDDEHLPVPTTTVTIEGRPENTTSDGGGKFTFNHLPAATYALNAGRPSFTSDTKTVTVVAGEITNVTFVLKFFQATDPPYQVSSERVGQILVGNDYVVWQIQQQNKSGTYDQVCQNCMMVFYFPPKPTAALTEVYWDCSAPCLPPVLNDNIWAKILINWTTGASGDGVVLANYYPKNRSQYVWPDASVAKLALAKGDRDLFELEAGQTGISYSITVHVWQSYAFNGPFPPAFTAMP